MAPTAEATERITRLIFAVLRDIIHELEAQEDLEGLDALPPVLLTTGVIALCQGLAPDTVMEILEGLRVKVERGDFSHIKIME